MRLFKLLTLVIVVMIEAMALTTRGETWVGPDTGGTWGTAANWDPAQIPNGEGAAAIFNANQTQNRTVSGASGTVGSISMDTSSVAANDFTHQLNMGSLTLNAAGAGPATISVTGNGTKLMTIGVALTLTDPLTVDIQNTTATAGAGALQFTAGIAGSGGVTKNGAGFMGYSNNNKNYTGPTVVNAGRMRITQSGQPAMTSSFTINAGGQIELNTAGSYTLGLGPLNLNGTGISLFPGAIRPARATAGLQYTVTNPVVLQTTSLIHMQSIVNATGANQITFSGSISGAGRLDVTEPSSGDQNIGSVILGGDNSYTGGTLLNGGELVVMGAAADLGTGNVSVVNVLPLSNARLSIAAGVANAIADSAALSLSGGGTADVADQGYANLEAGVNETVAALILGGLPRIPGTYGSSDSPATHQLNEFFSGAGIITVGGSLPGNFDGDSDVDGDDFAKWKQDFGPGNGSDADNDGDSDGSDFLVWQRNFDDQPGAASVPEPSSSGLLLLVLAALLRRTGRQA